MNYDGTQTTNCFVTCDGNGNMAALINATNGLDCGKYEYGPFGELIRATGPMAKANPFRFSTKYQDDETDLVYYGYRYYSASTGRWLSRDPLQEKGGLNLYCMVGNNAINLFDIDGRGVCDCLKAIKELVAATATLSRRVAEVELDRLGTGLDAGHIQALDDAVNRVNYAMRKVAQNCWDTAVAAAALAAAAEAISAALPYLEMAAPVLAL